MFVVSHVKLFIGWVYVQRRVGIVGRQFASIGTNEFSHFRNAAYQNWIVVPSQAHDLNILQSASHFGTGIRHALASMCVRFE